MREKYKPTFEIFPGFLGNSQKSRHRTELDLGVHELGHTFVELDPGKAWLLFPPALPPILHVILLNDLHLSRAFQLLLKEFLDSAVQQGLDINKSYQSCHPPVIVVSPEQSFLDDVVNLRNTELLSINQIEYLEPSPGIL